MLSYARADTHYLLYIYDILRNELVESSDRARPEMDLFDLLLQKCQKQALDRYEYPAFDATTGEGSGGWLHHLMRHPLSLNGEQFSVFRAVWKWRDTEARKADESVHYLLPSQAVRNIAQILPPDLKALISRLPRHMQKAEGLVYDLWRVIQEAKVAGRTGPTMRQFLSERNEPKAASTPERTGKTVNGTPIDPEGVVPAPILPKSQLFGDVPVREQDKAIRPKASDYIPFSWQALPRSLQPDAEDFGEEAEESDTATQQGTGAKSHVPSKPEAADEAAFNLRAGSKRRREENEHHGGKNSEDDEMVTGNAMLSEGEVHEGPSSPGGADEVMDLDDAAGAENAEKAAPKILRSREKKDRKKALKKARKAAADTTKKLANQQGAAAIQQSQQQAGDSGQPSVGPFDYSQASSVLHAKRDQGSGANVAQQAAFNPYSKSGDDGPKGARKAPPLPGGRSATFKQ
jgi:exosome complex exonuclease RRP6